MKQLAVLLGLALLPMAAWADGIDMTNQFGGLSVTTAGIVMTGSQLKSFEGITAPLGHSLGSVSFSTGALLSGSIMGGGTFSSVGSTFVVTGVGNFGQPKGTIFTGSFVGPILWTLDSTVGRNLTFTLTGTISGMFEGRKVTGTTTQTMYSTNGQLSTGIGHARMGTTNLAVPEPGTLGLLAMGLFGIAGTARRKIRSPILTC
jgi:PEP-CTERM motif